jgi:hypothetical protein
MKTYSISAAHLSEHKLAHPERTAYRSIGIGLDFDVTIQTWPNRASMLKTIQMQESGPDFRKAWRPFVKEGGAA